MRMSMRLGPAVEFGRTMNKNVNVLGCRRRLSLSCSWVGIFRLVYISHTKVQ